MQVRRVCSVLVAVLACLLCCAPAASGAYITLKIVENESSQKAAVTKAFKKAAKTWSKIIKTKLPTITNSKAMSVSNSCGVDYTFAKGSKIKNLIIFVSITSIDGVGSVLGSAGPCMFSKTDGYWFPRLGIMNLDSADMDRMVTKGTLQEVITHEMGHVLGFGTLWSSEDLTSGSSSIVYNGENGVDGYALVGGPSSATSVPVQSTGGSGTKGAHWSESTFSNELMTGTLNSGKSNPLSKMTVSSLKDLGYKVKVSKAQSYSVPSSSKSAAVSLSTSSENSTIDEDDDDVVNFEGDHIMINRSEPVAVFTDLNGTVEYIAMDDDKVSSWEIAVTTIAAFLFVLLTVTSACCCWYRNRARKAMRAAAAAEAATNSSAPVDAKIDETATNPAAPVTTASVIEAV
ncbi:Leishmanolysin-like [Hondaea fermentalgiana]|uniref:Leishmanolysin-like n=1 Tax=Hondaea fermentalgiana TaxID=2315210 RepID=A0A2R5GH34_9STRA|nr:Leishmanolysin-like [Hondaea fermentalgiana]|eukprot:GBG30202.1 Leishmanolysin-like [Hondaea fermentalgiana]